MMQMGRGMTTNLSRVNGTLKYTVKCSKCDAEYVSEWTVHLFDTIPIATCQGDWTFIGWPLFQNICPNHEVIIKDKT